MPGGKPVSSKWTSTGLQFLDKSGTVIHTLDGVNSRTFTPGVLYQVRRRCTAAEVNAGVTLLAAIAGFKYRMVNCSMIAYGGAVGAVTTIDVIGTQSTAQKLAAFAQASLTQSTELRAGDTGSTILADGASFVANDVNTAITVGITGSNVTVATGVDVILEYAVEAG